MPVTTETGDPMTQDTRKDRRVKIVSLNVRYKSATVDEFIENHAHDVSRGGIYIKTGSPFPPGTLLKFEIRLVSDQALITGVGRVVWKRDATQGTGDRPAGMGVKFIKIDDPSKTVIEKLVNARSDAGRAYESEAEASVPATQPTARAAQSRVGKSTILGVGAAGQLSPRPAPSSRPPGSHSSPPRPSSHAAMFPKSSPDASTEPKQEQTVMKQAAELLEEALREAGGSMEDIGTNPLFAGSAGVAAPNASEPPAPLASEPPIAESPTSTAEAERARAMVAEMSPGAAQTKSTSDAPRTTRESPVAKGPANEDRPGSVRPSPRPSVTSRPPKPPSKTGSGTLLLLGVVAAAAFAGVLFRDKLFGSGAATEPPPAATVVEAPPPAVTATATASALPSVAEPEAPTPSASAAPSASASTASPSSSASALPKSFAVPARPFGARPPVQPGSVPAIAPKASSAPAVVPAAPDESSAAPAPTAPAMTAAPATATATPAPTASAPPVKPKATAKPADDNPY
jgi:uncharacterized protein (TIGR02266 family)